jgi:crossover junction endodeoxyribonuclease RuvC
VTFVGIDVGSSGAIAVINPDTRNVFFFDTPTVTMKVGKKFKTSMDPHRAAAILGELPADGGILISIEKVSAMPSVVGPHGEERRTMGVTSAFSFGANFGMWVGICAALQLPYQLVHPATWKAKLLRDMAKGKDASRVKAMQLYPQTAKDLTRKKDHARGDACLLAHYGLMFGAPQKTAAEEPEPSLFG